MGYKYFSSVFFFDGKQGDHKSDYPKIYLGSSIPETSSSNRFRRHIERFQSPEFHIQGEKGYAHAL